ncbi:MAG: hypothetical protein QOH41_4240 [Blastocatellia bacterium]|nr:hypothetical protein [Blastocatellia bacterium]
MFSLTPKPQECNNNRGLKRHSSTIIKMLMVTILLMAGSYRAFGQNQPSTPAPTPAPSAEELRLAEQNRVLALEKTNAQLKKDIREAQPQPAATPLEGKTTADENVVIETQLVTYKAMSDVADRIGGEIHQKFTGAKSIAIYDAEELQNLKHYRDTSPILDGRIEGLKDQYGRVLEKLSAISRPRTVTVTTSESLVRSLNSIQSGVSSTTASISASVATDTAVESLLPGVNTVGVGLKAFADLLALMRTDTEIKGKSVTVEERAMVAETFRALRNRFGSDVNLYYPQVVPPEIYLEGCQDRNSRVFCSHTLSELAGLYAEKENAENQLLAEMFETSSQFDKATAQKSQAESELKDLAKQIGDLKLDRLKAELEKPWTPAQATRFDKFISDLEARKSAAQSSKSAAESQLEYSARKKNVLERLQDLNRQADELVANLAKPDEKTGRSELANFLRAENIDKALGTNGYWLEFKSISAGGNNRIQKNLFRYFSGAKIDHSGGIVVEWALYNRNGVSVDSNKDSSYGGYLTPKEIQSAQFRDTVDDVKVARPAIAKSEKQ